MKIAPLAEVKDQLSAYVEDSKHAPVIITKNGRAVAALIAIQDEDDLDSILLSYHPRIAKLLEDAQARVQKTGGVPEDKFFAELKRRRAAH